MLATLLALIHYLFAPVGVKKSSSSTNSKMANNAERTFIMIKPDGVHRGLVGDIIKRFEQKGFKLVALKFMQVKKKLFFLEYFRGKFS